MKIKILLTLLMLSCQSIFALEGDTAGNGGDLERLSIRRTEVFTRERLNRLIRFVNHEDNSFKKMLKEFSRLFQLIHDPSYRHRNLVFDRVRYLLSETANADIRNEDAYQNLLRITDYINNNPEYLDNLVIVEGSCGSKVYFTNNDESHIQLTSMCTENHNSTAEIKVDIDNSIGVRSSYQNFMGMVFHEISHQILGDVDHDEGREYALAFFISDLYTNKGEFVNGMFLFAMDWILNDYRYLNFGALKGSDLDNFISNSEFFYVGLGDSREAFMKRIQFAILLDRISTPEFYLDTLDITFHFGAMYPQYFPTSDLTPYMQHWADSHIPGTPFYNVHQRPSYREYDSYGDEILNFRINLQTILHYIEVYNVSFEGKSSHIYPSIINEELYDEMKSLGLEWKFYFPTFISVLRAEGYYYNSLSEYLRDEFLESDSLLEMISLRQRNNPEEICRTSVLHMAAWYSKWHSDYNWYDAILSRGGDENLLDSSGYTPRDILERADDDETYYSGTCNSHSELESITRFKYKYGVNVNPYGYVYGIE